MNLVNPMLKLGHMAC